MTDKITKEKLQTLRKQGLSAKDIAKFFNCSIATVKNAIRYYNLPRKKPGRPRIISD